MVYTMKIYVDGGCRNNGKPGAIGAAAAVFQFKYDHQQCYTRELPESPTPTNQRAEITAIILALQQALKRYKSLDSDPYLDVTIYSDSRYAVNCMNEWIYKWSRNGWKNSTGAEVVNRDLIQKASDLDDLLAKEGDVRYVWVPREENNDADKYCNEVMDQMEEQYF